MSLKILPRSFQAFRGSFRSHLHTSVTPSSLYADLVRKHQVEPSPEQTDALKHFDRLHDELSRFVPQRQAYLDYLAREKARIAAAEESRRKQEQEEVGENSESATQTKEEPPVSVPRGLYLSGHVGTGKTMLMDLFVRSLPRDSIRVRRVHFHQFMADFHKQMSTRSVQISEMKMLRRMGEIPATEPLPDPFELTAQDIADQSWLLAFDEMHITDPADAQILKRLFEALFERGCVLVTTSNRSPEELYLGGINRSLFLDFIELMKERCECLTLDGNPPKDYRMKFAPAPGTYFHPLSESTSREFETRVRELAKNSDSEQSEIFVAGTRKLVIPWSANGVARFDFSELCENALGPSDYLALCREFHTIAVANVPQLTAKNFKNLNAVKRFIMLVDLCYENGRRLVMSCHVPQEQLFSINLSEMSFEDRALTKPVRAVKNQIKDLHGDLDMKKGIDLNVVDISSPQADWSSTQTLGLAPSELSSVSDTSFAYRRAASRINEMQSVEYWTRTEPN